MKLPEILDSYEKAYETAYQSAKKEILDVCSAVVDIYCEKLNLEVPKDQLYSHLKADFEQTDKGQKANHYAVASTLINALRLPDSIEKDKRPQLINYSIKKIRESYAFSEEKIESIRTTRSLSELNKVCDRLVAALEAEQT